MENNNPDRDESIYTIKSFSWNSRLHTLKDHKWELIEVDIMEEMIGVDDLRESEYIEFMRDIVWEKVKIKWLKKWVMSEYAAKRAEIIK
jgi:hypothetical protein